MFGPLDGCSRCYSQKRTHSKVLYICNLSIAVFHPSRLLTDDEDAATPKRHHRPRVVRRVATPTLTKHIAGLVDSNLPLDGTPVYPSSVHEFTPRRLQFTPRRDTASVSTGTPTWTVVVACLLHQRARLLIEWFALRPSQRRATAATFRFGRHATPPV